jgi:hypothetical protein
MVDIVAARFGLTPRGVLRGHAAVAVCDAAARVATTATAALCVLPSQSTTVKYFLGPAVASAQPTRLTADGPGALFHKQSTETLSCQVNNAIAHLSIISRKAA